MNELSKLPFHIVIPSKHFLVIYNTLILYKKTFIDLIIFLSGF